MTTYKDKEGNVLTDRELEQMFDDSFNDCFGNVTIGIYEYNASYALKNVDEIAYREAFLDWLDDQITNEEIFEINE